MKHFLKVCLILICCLWTSTIFASEYIEGEVLVVTKNQNVKYNILSHTLRNTKTYIKSAYSALEDNGKNILHVISEEKTTQELIEELSKQNGILSVTPNYIVKVFLTPNDPEYNNQWALNNISSEKAWNETTGNNNVYVAVIDTGIDYNHEDIQNNMGKDLNNKYGYDAFGYDPMDNHGHGTHVAGIIGGVGNNNKGIVGVAWNIKLLAVKVLDSSGRGSSSTIIDGLNYILEQKRNGLNIKAANMSLGGWQPIITNPESDPYALAHKQISDAGIVLVVAAGNDGQNLDNTIGKTNELVYPACFQFENMITVGAIDSSNNITNFSNTSPTYVHLGAPGENILSTIPYNEYTEFDGTSMATPYVTGVVALLASKYSTDSAILLKNKILANVDNISSMENAFMSGGKLNAYKALTGSSTLPPAAVKNVFLNQSELTLQKGETKQLIATIQPMNASNKNVTWISDNPQIASVSNGLVIGNSGGRTNISVITEDGNKKATCEVLVPYVSVDYVSITPSYLNLTKGNVGYLTAQVYPQNAENKKVTWKSTNPLIAFVDNNGLVMTVSNGSTTIIVETQDGRKTATASVYVTGYDENDNPTLEDLLAAGGCNMAPEYTLQLFFILIPLFFLIKWR